MGFFLRLLSHRYHDELAMLRIDLDPITIANSAIKNATGDTVLDLSLDDALEGTGSELRVVAHHCQSVKRHVYNIFSKLGVKNRIQALARARALGLLDEQP